MSMEEASQPSGSGGFLFEDIIEVHECSPDQQRAVLLHTWRIFGRHSGQCGAVRFALSSHRRDRALREDMEG
jgi:hypothetical protein